MGWRDEPLVETPAQSAAPAAAGWAAEPLVEGRPFPAEGAVPVPEWAVRNPELYGLAGAAREAVMPVVSGLMGAGGAIGGIAMGGPVGGVAGGAGGYMAGEELGYIVDQALGLRGPRQGAAKFSEPLYNLGLGAALETGGAAVGAGLNQLSGLMRPRWAAINALLRSGGEQLPEQIRAGQQVAGTPGVSRTLTEEVLASGGRPAPSLAALERRIPATGQQTSDSVFRFYETRRNALQDQLERIDQTIQTQASQLAPQQMNQLRTVRDNLLNQLTQAQDGLARAQSGLAQANMPQGQQQFGETLIERAQDIRQGVRQKTIQPLFADAFAKAADAPLDLSKVVSDAETILGRKLSDFAPDSAPRTVRALAALRPAPETTIIRQPGMPPIPKTTQAEPTATLQQLDDIRKAINEDIKAAKQGAATSSIDSIALRQLSQLHRSIDDAVQNSTTLSAEAKQAYDTAIRTYREEFVPRFRVGLPAKMLSQTKLNEPGILAGDVVERFLGAKERGMDQVLRLYGGDKTAMQALRGGVEDLFRARVVDPVTLRVDPAKAQAFLTRYDQQLAQLDAAGLNIRSGLDDVMKQAQQIDRGMRSLDDLARSTQSRTATDMIDRWLADKTRMGQGIGMLSADGREALAAETRRRAMDFVRNGDGAGAVKFLEDNAETVKMALGKGKGYDELLDTAKWAKQTQEVSRQAQAGGPVQRQAVNLIQSYSPKQLTDLQVVIDDLERIRTVTRLAGEGAASPSPIAGKIVTEDLQRASASSSEIPNPLVAKITVAKGVFSKLEQFVNRRAAAVLAEYMYHNPQKAAAAIEAELAKRKQFFRTPTARRAASFTGLSSAQDEE